MLKSFRLPELKRRNIRQSTLKIINVAAILFTQACAVRAEETAKQKLNPANYLGRWHQEETVAGAKVCITQENFTNNITNYNLSLIFSDKQDENRGSVASYEITINIQGADEWQIENDTITTKTISINTSNEAPQVTWGVKPPSAKEKELLKYELDKIILDIKKEIGSSMYVGQTSTMKVTYFDENKITYTQKDEDGTTSFHELIKTERNDGKCRLPDLPKWLLPTDR